MVAEGNSPAAQSSSGEAYVEDQPFGQFGQDNFAELGPVVYSILVADCGSSFTRVSLLERVETGFSFVAHGLAPTTTEPPWSDVSVGVRHAIEQITETTKRQLLNDNGALLIPEDRGRGIDLLIVTCSAAQPLRVVLAGLVSQVSLASLERAAASSYVDVLGMIARDFIGAVSVDGLPGDRDAASDLPMPDGLTEAAEDQARSSSTDEDKVALIRRQHPDVVWVAGGTDGGSREPVRDLVETVALGCTLVDGPPRPAIIYAGNSELRSEIVDLIGEEVQLEVVDNVRPNLETENLSAARVAFQTAYVERKVQRLPGIGNLISWSSAPMLSTAQALQYLVMYLERLYESGKGVLCADVGSSTTTVATSLPVRMKQAEDEGKGQHTLHVATDLGIGYSAPVLLERVGERAIAQWLPFEPEPGEVASVLFNKGLRPTTIPVDRRQLLIEQAAAREALRQVMGRARESWRAGSGRPPRWMMPLFEPIIATGGVLTQAPRPSQAVLMLLDALEPVGITTLVLDEYGLASVLGAVAVTHPLAAVQALDAGPFLTLGTVISPVGRARLGDVIMRVKITFDQGGELEIEAKYGSLELVPLRTGEKALMELKPRRGFRVGQTAKPVEVHGGAVGLIIDARGRPLRLPPDEEACRRLIQQWLWEMGA